MSAVQHGEARLAVRRGCLAHQAVVDQGGDLHHDVYSVYGVGSIAVLRGRDARHRLRREATGEGGQTAE